MEKTREFLLFEAGNSRDKTRLLLSMSTTELQLDPVYAEALTPEQFLELYEQGLKDIKSVRVIPPELGSIGFGKIIVLHKVPIYVTRFDQTNKVVALQKRNKDE
jgi:hypothetical protein